MNGQLHLLGMLLLLGTLICGCISDTSDPAEAACLQSGGNVTLAMCCKQTDDFPDLCRIGACGCSPEDSHEVKVCDCGESRCFNGSACVDMEDSVLEYISAGKPDGQEMDGFVRLTEEQARSIARNSSCTEAGNLSDSIYYNSLTFTWWIDLIPYTKYPGCRPACVVSELTGTAMIDYRCTGTDSASSLHDVTYTVCLASTGEQMTIGEALQIAGSGVCAEFGTPTGQQVCNSNTGTWWIDLEPYIPMPGCKPACVVNVKTGAAEVNPRCTGAILVPIPQTESG